MCYIFTTVASKLRSWSSSTANVYARDALKWVISCKTVLPYIGQLAFGRQYRWMPRYPVLPWQMALSLTRSLDQHRVVAPCTVLLIYWRCSTHPWNSAAADLSSTRESPAIGFVGPQYDRACIHRQAMQCHMSWNNFMQSADATKDRRAWKCDWRHLTWPEWMAIDTGN